MEAIWDLLGSFGLTETVVQFILINAILGISIYLTLYTGMFSLANAGFMAIGAYVAVICTQQLGLPLGVALVIAVVICGVVALPLGLPVLRLHDIYLAIATIGFGEIVRIFFLNFDNIAGDLTGERVKITGGPIGIKGIPKLTETWHLILFLVVIGYLITRLHRSRFGRAMVAIREDETVAATMGINLVYHKTVVFVMGAMLAGAGGAFSGHLTRIIAPGSFGFDRVVGILTYAVLGGTVSWVGPIVGAAILTALPEMFRFLREFNQVFNGIILVAVIIYLPSGVVNPPGWQRALKRLRGRRDDGEAVQEAAS